MLLVIGIVAGAGAVGCILLSVGLCRSAGKADEAEEMQRGRGDDGC